MCSFPSCVFQSSLLKRTGGLDEKVDWNWWSSHAKPSLTSYSRKYSTTFNKQEVKELKIIFSLYFFKIPGMMFYHQERCRDCALLGFSTCSRNTQVICLLLEFKQLDLRDVRVNFWLWFQCWMKPPALWQKTPRNTCTELVNSWAWLWLASVTAAAWNRYPAHIILIIIIYRHANILG